MTVQPQMLSNKPSALQFSDDLYYRFDGDLAQLGAGLHIVDPATLQHQQCSLQLWACAAPFTGGELNGIKVAEVNVAVHADGSAIQQQSAAIYPAGQMDYSMVMALVTESSDGLPVINDFVNFSQRQQFCQPRLVGVVNAELSENLLQLQVEEIENPRGQHNISGSLSLELWATDEPYRGGGFSGEWLAGITLGQIDGGNKSLNNSFNLDLAAQPQAGKSLALMLREWTECGFITRDFRLLPPVLVEITDAEPAAASVKETVKEVVAEIKAPVAEVKAVVAETKAPVAEVKAVVAETKAPVAEVKAAVAETKAPVAEVKAAVAETKAPVAEVKAAVAETKAADVKASAKPEQVVAEKPAVKAAEPAKAAPVAETAKAYAKAAETVVAKTGVAKFSGTVSVNSASEDELAQLNGMTGKLAKAIIAGRPYKSLDELVKIRGIGEKLVNKLRTLLSL